MVLSFFTCGQAAMITSYESILALASVLSLLFNSERKHRIKKIMVREILKGIDWSRHYFVKLAQFHSNMPN